MGLEEDMKLDDKDVLIRPKRSVLGSRKEVDLERGFTWRNWQPEDMSMEQLRPDTRHWRGMPIMASNMDGVGTFEMADAFTSSNRTSSSSYSSGLSQSCILSYKSV